MNADKVRKPPPVWLLLIIFTTLFSSISLFLIYTFDWPWHLPHHTYWSVAFGVVLLILGFFILVSALRTLKLRRAFGKEIYKPKQESSLITTGIYAYIRNPVYVGCIILFLGWFFVTWFTFFLILTVLFLIHFCIVAKWEEIELTNRFGEEYLRYKARVRFFIPHFRKPK